jgi:3-phenylpropionate/cinnamic acid dioxygenase small subunit
MNASSEPSLHDMQQFLFREAALLDSGRWEEWLELFTLDGYYWVPLVPNQSDAQNHVSLFYEDAMLRQMRVRRLRHPRAFSQQTATRTSHIVGNVMRGEYAASSGEVIVQSNFQMLQFHKDSQTLFGGSYTHTLVWQNGDFKIKLKRVDLLNCDGIHEALQVFI